MDFNELFADVPENLVVLSPEFRILAATNSYLAATMRTREELVGLHFLKEAFPEKDTPYEQNPVKFTLEKVLATKEDIILDVIRYDIVQPQALGGGYKVVFWEISYLPRVNAEGEVKYILVKILDVTEQELAQKSARMLERKFYIMTDSVPQIIYTTNPEGKLTYVNQRWSRYTGLSSQEAIASEKSWLEVVHPEDQPELKARTDEAYSQGKAFQAEMRLRNAAGQYRWFMNKSTPVKLTEAGEIALWVGSSTDIHATRQMVAELVQTNEQMALLSDQVQEAFNITKNERATLERLIMEAPAVFCTLKGPDHRYDLVNPYYQDLFPKKELQNRTVAEALPEVVEQGFIAVLDEVYATGKPFVAKEILIKLDRYDTGVLEDVYMTLNYQAMYNEEDTIIGILVFGYDITESVKTRQELQALTNA